MNTQLHADVSEDTVRQIAEQHDEPEWLLQARLSAVRAFDDLDFPSVIRTPGRKWTHLEALDYDELVDPHGQTEQKELVEAEGVDVLPFHEALEEHPELVKERFGSIVDPEQNKLVALSTALFTTGTVVYVPEGVDAEDVKIRTTMEDRSLFNYTLVVTEANSSVTILERQTTGEGGATESHRAEGGEAAGAPEGKKYYSGVVEVAAGENSQAQYGALQNFDRETYNYTVKKAVADTYSTVSWIEGNLGSRLTKTGVETTLSGDSSETKIVGAFFGDGDQHFDLDAKVWHEAEHTTADLVTRGVIDDEARSVYEGVQNVGSEAWDTSSYQRENTLMLSDESEADASPKLIINNHDTEASHSATVGQIDREDLFYMQGRGLPAETARNLLVEGFFVPVLEEVAVDELRDDIQDLVAQRLRE